MLPSSLASLDSTLPPTPLRELLAAAGASIFVFSDDIGLIRSLEEAGGEQYPIYVAEDWQELVDAVASQRTHIVLLDVDSLTAPCEAALTDLERVGRALVVLVAARRDASQSLMALLSRRRIHRLLIKPAASGITRLLLESAVGRYLQLREQLEPVAVVDDVRMRRRRRRPRSSVRPWLLATGIVVLIAGVVAIAERYGIRPPESFESFVATLEWIPGLDSTAEDGAANPESGESVSEDDASADSGSAAARAESSARGTLESLLGGALASVGRVLDSAGEDEPETSAAVESESPARNAPVEARVDRAAVAAAPGARVDRAPAFASTARTGGGTDIEGSSDPSTPFSEGDETPAIVAATGNRTATASAAPSDGAASLSAALGVASDRTLEPGQPSAAALDLDDVLALLDARLDDGRLLEPANDSALGYFERAMSLAPNDPRVLLRRTAVARGLVAEARIAIRRDDIDRAQSLAAEAFRLGAERETLALLDLDIDAARRALTRDRHAELMATATARLREGRLIADDGDDALRRLATLRRENASVPGLDAAWRELTAAVSASTRAAVAAGDYETALSWAESLAIDGGDAELASELAFEARQGQYLATPAPSSVVELLETPALVYPQDASRRGVEGWVELEFVVDREGRTRDVVVVDSRPRRWFDDAAIETIANQRYAPFTLDGRRYERLVHLRIRFDLR